MVRRGALPDKEINLVKTSLGQKAEKIHYEQAMFSFLCLRKKEALGNMQQLPIGFSFFIFKLFSFFMFTFNNS